MRKKFEKIIGESKINYYSDLFVCAAVILWIVGAAIFTPMAVYATFVFMDVSIWSYWVEYITIPIASGLGLWMIKNCVNHAMYNRGGKEAPYDFPKVNAEGEDDGVESNTDSNEEEDTVG